MIFQVCKMLALSSHQKAVNIDISRRSRYGSSKSSPIFSFAKPGCQICFYQGDLESKGDEEEGGTMEATDRISRSLSFRGGRKKPNSERFFWGEESSGNSGAKRSAKNYLLVFLFFFWEGCNCNNRYPFIFGRFSGSRHNSIYNDRRGPSKHPPFHPTAIVREKISWDPLVSCDSENNGKTWVYPPWKLAANAPEKLVIPKGKNIFQLLIFRGYVSFIA